MKKVKALKTMISKIDVTQHNFQIFMLNINLSRGIVASHTFKYIHRLTGFEPERVIYLLDFIAFIPLTHLFLQKN